MTASMGSKKTASIPAQIRPIIEKLFITMGIFFHEAFTDLYPAGNPTLVAKRAWESYLSDLGDAYIEYGLTALKNWTYHKPPTIGQFRELCLKKPAEQIITPLRVESDEQRAKNKAAAEKYIPEMIAKLKANKSKSILPGSLPS